MLYEADSQEIVDTIHRLRVKTGRGFMECRAALEICGMNEKLALGYLYFNGLAVNIKPRDEETKESAYRRWVLEQAKELTASLS